MTTSTMELLPGTEVHARGLRWEVVSSQSLGPQTLFRLRGLENAVLGQKKTSSIPSRPSSRFATSCDPTKLHRWRTGWSTTRRSSWNRPSARMPS